MPSVRERLTRSRTRPPIQGPDKVDFEDVVARLEAHDQPVDRELLTRVYEFSVEKHGDQKRRSGEPYVTHPVQVAYTLADLGFDATCVAAGLLHDVLEDTLATREELVERFGEDIAHVVVMPNVTPRKVDIFVAELKACIEQHGRTAPKCDDSPLSLLSSEMWTPPLRSATA